MELSEARQQLSSSASEAQDKKSGMQQGQGSTTTAAAPVKTCEPDGFGDVAADVQVTMPPENAGQEETLALHERIELLEKRCSTLQNRLNSRPIIYQASGTDGPDPLLLESGSGSSDGSSSIVRRLVEHVLRNFTKRLLKRDAWLFIFYAHLIVLYAISGSCLSMSSGQHHAGDCVDVTMKQDSAAVATSSTGR